MPNLDTTCTCEHCTQCEHCNTVPFTREDAQACKSEVIATIEYLEERAAAILTEHRKHSRAVTALDSERQQVLEELAVARHKLSQCFVPTTTSTTTDTNTETDVQ